MSDRTDDPSERRRHLPASAQFRPKLGYELVGQRGILRGANVRRGTVRIGENEDTKAAAPVVAISPPHPSDTKRETWTEREMIADDRLFIVSRNYEPKASEARHLVEYGQRHETGCPVHPRTVARRLTPPSIAVNEPTNDDMFEDLLAGIVVTDIGRHAIETANLTGVRFRSISATEIGARQIGYWELLPLGFAGFMRAKCVESVEVCPCGDHVCYRTRGTLSEFIDRDKLDGSDVFIVWPFHKFVIFSARFVSQMRARGIRGFDFDDVASLNLEGAIPDPPRIALTIEQQVRLSADSDYQRIVLTRMSGN